MEDVFLEYFISTERRYPEVTYAAHSYAMLIKSRPLDHVRFQCVINLGYEFESQRLYRVSIYSLDSRYRRYTFNTVVGGMQ